MDKTKNDLNHYYATANDICVDENFIIQTPKIIARVKLCGGALTFSFDDTMHFEMPTKEQCENLKKTFGIEVELANEE